jgi:integrase
MRADRKPPAPSRSSDACTARSLVDDVLLGAWFEDSDRIDAVDSRSTRSRRRSAPCRLPVSPDRLRPGLRRAAAGLQRGRRRQDQLASRPVRGLPSRERDGVALRWSATLWDDRLQPIRRSGRRRNAPVGVPQRAADRLDDVGESTVAQAYRLLRAVMNTALDDELIRGRSPCRIKGADKEHAAERPVAAVAQVYAIAEASKPWYRALVLTAAMTGLRWGELVALRRRHLDLDGGFVDVRSAVVEDGTNLTVDRTKSEAGARVVGLPAVIVPELRSHLAKWSEAGPNGRVFVGPKGATPRRSNFNRAWAASLVRAEARGTALPEGLHFHDLRHTANEFAASSASVKELMARMGHSTARAALIYQRARRDREREIAATVSARVEKALRKRAK